MGALNRFDCITFFQASSQGKPKTHPDAPVTTLGAELNQGYTQAHQAVVKPFNINSEIQDKLTIAMGQKPGENVNKNVNAANKNNNSNKDVDDVSDDEGSTSETDSDEYTTESESEIDEDNRVVNNKEGTEVQSENGANSKPTHNQFIHVGNKGINLDKDNGLKDVGKAENRIHHSFDKERKMLTFSDTSSEFNESENEDMDIKHSGHEIQENYSPTKVLTRKVAGRDDRKAGGDARTQLHKVSCESIDAFSHNVIEDLDSSSFAPKAKSPFVISKEKVLTSQAPLPIKHDVLKSDKFVYHSDSDSNGGKVKDGFSDGDSSDASETELKTKPKTFYERKTLQFDDDSEWDDKTPVASRTRKRRSELGTEDHDKTLVEEPDEKGKVSFAVRKPVLRVSDED